MSFLKVLIIVVQVLSALGVIGLVLLQHGKGADMGAAFGSGASGSLFGATGSANFLSRTTAILATVFFISTLALTYLGSYKSAPSIGLLGGQAVPASAAAASQPATASGASVPAATSGASAAVPASTSSQDVPK
ncbi:preprotein translocase subunit SecG [Burkholderia sp. Ac-20379]|uniref:preprotein translocase subunit SecG n=1 Tax=Burkholderia sp. Ac-20379 TaxID=2703900 RepID=UPI00197FD9DD|nr:preprotein translocase subunit SecG [Burkholderia sp. Ac-20379]MBN3723332.1 preprotein translocase subunit SecG [Burkholderia sp. Ac-20379]